MKTKKLVIYLLGMALYVLSANASASDSCPDGLIWNEHIKECLNAEDDGRVNNKQQMCDSKAAGAGKDECNQMVQSFAKDPKSHVSTTKVGVSKKEKSIKKVGTAVSTGMAAVGAFKLFQAYKAAKSVKGVFSNMCISGMISIATGVMSFINDKSMDKKAKQTLKAAKQNLDALLAENERSKGTSYEMQIKLMQAYKQLLDAGAQAAQIREDGYKQEVMMYSISLGIAAIEIVIYSIPPNIQPDKIKCAAWVAGTSTVSLAIGSKMKSAAAKAKAKYKKESSQIANILKKYMDFFNKKHIDRRSLEMKLASNSGAVAPINAKEGSEANKFKNTNLTQAEKNMCEAAPGTSCCNDSGKTCPTFKMSIGNPTVSSAIGKSDLTGAFDRADARLKGNLNLGDRGVSLAIDGDLKRSLAFKQRVLQQLKDKGRLSNEQAELFDTDKQMKAFLKKNYGNENANLASSFGDNMALPEVDRIGKIIADGDVPKELKKDQKKLNSSFDSLSAMAKLKNSMNNLALEDDMDNGGGLSKAGELASNGIGLGKDEEYVYDKEDIVDKPEVNIFQVISNRYNVLRINKRFGQSVNN